MRVRTKSNKVFSIFIIILTLGVFGCQNSSKKEQNEPEKLPNIVIIYMDDLGYGDVGAYGATEIHTPNMDKLANGGVRFTTGYASSATCSPSRYALLTGQYPWRNENAKILPGTAPLLIGTEQLTIPKMLKEKGYYTGVVGKWHLGLGSGNVDWNETIAPGPNQVGFDYSYIMAATQDRVPTVYIKDGNVVGLEQDDPIQVNYQKNFEGEPTGKDNPELLKMKWHHGHNNSIVNGIPRIGFMKGGEKAKWIDEDMADTFLEKAKQYVQQHKDGPFFLYYALQQPHVPRTPNERFVGLSGMGPRGDAIVEADWCIGEFIQTLQSEGILDNTLIIFSSDNGPVLNDGYYDDAVEKLGDHTPWGPLRGGKYSLFEAGTRVPFVVYWNGKVTPGVSDAMVSQIDIFSSLAELVGSDNKTEDSKNLLDVFMGKSEKGREELVLEATSRTALRKGNWVMIPPYEGPAKNNSVNIELGNSSEFQLYDLSSDIGEQKNQAKENPEKLQEMVEIFKQIRGADFENIQQLELK
ncbi:sulfatase family protein [Maribellus maritimus]|uniref:sulfatase family protein n=1 Tax=Maribellus maritimus TaxID=2870838 RepID=UPI001EEA14DF|nr:arylsulfatase [Maribellus maritimus]MCG6189167.1 arylsulfatase [Maribellus maritimus]